MRARERQKTSVRCSIIVHFHVAELCMQYSSTLWGVLEYRKQSTGLIYGTRLNNLCS